MIKESYTLSVFIILLGISCSIDEKTKFDDNYRVITKTLIDLKGDKTASYEGLIDSSGEIVIPPVYTYVNELGSGIALIAVKDTSNYKYGYVNLKNEYVIDPIYQDAKNFSKEKIARVKFEDKWRYINSSGEHLFSTDFDLAGPFSEGLATVKFGNKYGYIDDKGHLAISPNLDFWSSSHYSQRGDFPILTIFSNGLAGTKHNDKYGFIDIKGNLVIPFIYDEIFPFENGYATVGKKISPIFDGDNQSAPNIDTGSQKYEEVMLYGIINTEGEEIIETKYLNIGNANQTLIPAVEYKSSIFEEIHLASVIKPFKSEIPDIIKCQLGYLNHDGNWVIPPIFEYAYHEYIEKYEFSEGLAFACQNDTCGYINTSGQFEIDKIYFRTDRYSTSEKFSEGLAAVSITPNAINSHPVLRNLSTYAYSMNENGLKYIGYIDKKGKFVILPQFQSASPFQSGVGSVTNLNDCIAKGNCYIDKLGDYIWYDKNSTADIEITKDLRILKKK